MDSQLDKQDIKGRLLSKVQAFLEINAKEKTVEFFGIQNFSEIKTRKEGGLVLFYHPSFNNKELTYLNEEELTDFLIFENNNVYIDYNENLFTFDKIKDEEKLMRLDLGNQEIQEGPEEKKIDSDQMDEDFPENFEGKHTDLITVNYFPIAPSHLNLALFSDQNYAQVLSNEFLIQTLQIFNMVDNPNLRLGYDSLGAGCLINHLHFELLFIDDLNLEKLNIENSPLIPIFKTTLTHKEKEEIKMFDENIEVIFSFVDYYIKCWKISFNRKNPCENILDKDNHINSMTHFVDFIMSTLVDLEIPHNLVISEKGHSFYIIPRQFTHKDHFINTSWHDLCGLVTFKDDGKFNSLTENEIIGFLQENVGLGNEKYEQTVETLTKKFEEIYETYK